MARERPYCGKNGCGRSCATLSSWVGGCWRSLALALPTFVVLIAATFLFYGYRVKVARRPMMPGLEAMQHALGRVRSLQGDTAAIWVNSELWSAQSGEELHEGDEVEVMAVEGLLLRDPAVYSKKEWKLPHVNIATSEAYRDYSSITSHRRTGVRAWHWTRARDVDAGAVPGHGPRRLGRLWPGIDGRRNDGWRRKRGRMMSGYGPRNEGSGQGNASASGARTIFLRPIEWAALHELAIPSRAEAQALTFWISRTDTPGKKMRKLGLPVRSAKGCTDSGPATRRCTAGWRGRLRPKSWPSLSFNWRAQPRLDLPMIGRTTVILFPTRRRRTDMIELTVKDMTCNHCVGVVTKAVSRSTRTPP